jgi:uncharacterized protein YkwD
VLIASSVVMATFALPVSSSFGRSGCAHAHARPGGVSDQVLQRATLCLLNVQRARHHLGPLRLDAHLIWAAESHASDMVARRYFSHRAASGTGPGQRIHRAGFACRGCRTAENIAWRGSRATPWAMVRAWMHSPPHRANILDRRLRLVGPGMVRGTPLWYRHRGGTYVTDFAG